MRTGTLIHAAIYLLDIKASCFITHSTTNEFTEVLRYNIKVKISVLYVGACVMTPPHTHTSC